MKNTKSVCIFDFDGTLVDSMGGLADLAALLIEDHHGLTRQEARQKYLQTSGLPFHQQLEKIFPNHGLNKKVAEAFESRKKQQYLDQILFEETKTTLQELRSSGIKVGVSSNNFQKLVEEYIQKHSLELDLVLGFRQGFAKGEAHFKQVLKHFNVSVGEMLFVGDSLEDGREAKEFGIDFIARSGTFSAALFQEKFPGVRVIPHLKELIPILCK